MWNELLSCTNCSLFITNAHAYTYTRGHYLFRPIGPILLLLEIYVSLYLSLYYLNNGQQGIAQFDVAEKIYYRYRTSTQKVRNL